MDERSILVWIGIAAIISAAVPTVMCATGSSTAEPVVKGSGSTDLKPVHPIYYPPEEPPEIFFAKGSAEIGPDQLPALRQVLGQIQRNETWHTVRVNGHSDDGGDDENNLELGSRRAVAVRAWLIEHGVAPERLRVVTFGNAAERTGKHLNRRVDFTVP